jgi:hypothetical protein
MKQIFFLGLLNLTSSGDWFLNRKKKLYIATLIWSPLKSLIYIDGIEWNEIISELQKL